MLIKQSVVDLPCHVTAFGYYRCDLRVCMCFAFQSNNDANIVYLFLFLLQYLLAIHVSRSLGLRVGLLSSSVLIQAAKKAHKHKTGKDRRSNT